MMNPLRSSLRLFTLAMSWTLATLSSAYPQTEMDKTIYQFTMNDIHGQPVSLKSFEGKVVLIVNVASECGLTPQYEDLQTLYSVKSDEGFVILGFPANNFMGQEPGSDEEIQSFCTSKFGVNFPMFSKIDVVGKEQHPLYKFLTEEDLNGVMDSEVTWNFQKYLIDRTGHLVTTFKPRTKVDNEEVLAAIREEIGKK